MPEKIASAVLKAKQHRLRDGFARDFSLRIHRAISWLQGAEAAIERYVDLICSLDRQGVVYDVIWRRFAQSIRTLLDNHFVFAAFWRHQHGNAGFADWRQRFSRERRRIHKALGDQDTATVLTVLFDRLYVLRNQLIHGGATWRGGVNREQVRDGVDILSFLIPHFVDVMMDNPACDWGRPPYPVVDG